MRPRLKRTTFMDTDLALNLHPGARPVPVDRDADPAITAEYGAHRRLDTIDMRGRRLMLVAVDIDAAHFDATSFARRAIARPPTVARSVVRRQAEFFSGRVAASIALAYADHPVVDIPIGDQRQPLWPDGIVGSISHTDSVAMACAFGAQPPAGVGVDVERVVTEEAAQALVSSAFDAGECSRLEAAFGGDRLTALTVGFSAKESLYKAAFADVRRFFDFSAARVEHVDPHARYLRLRLTETLSERFFCGASCDVCFDFLGESAVMTHFQW